VSGTEINGSRHAVVTEEEKAGGDVAAGLGIYGGQYSVYKPHCAGVDIGSKQAFPESGVEVRLDWFSDRRRIAVVGLAWLKVLIFETNRFAADCAYSILLEQVTETRSRISSYSKRKTLTTHMM
jgi:hypothetical protein